MKKRTITMLTTACISILTLAGCSGHVTESESDSPAEDVVEFVEIEEEEAEEAEEAELETEEVLYVTAEWTDDQLAALNELFGGKFDMEFGAGAADKYDVHGGIDYDDGIIRGIVFNTSEVDFDTPGEYTEGYTIHFIREALLGWMESHGIDPAEYTGMDAAAERVIVKTTGTITITGDATQVADEDADENPVESEEAAKTQTADTSSAANMGNSGTSNGSGNSGTSNGSGNNGTSNSGFGSTGSSGGSSSASNGSSGSSTACDHNWVATYHEATGHYESVLVSEAYDEKVDTGKATYECNNCGYQTTSASDIGGHTMTVCGGCGYKAVDLYETVHHDAVYDQKWVEDSAAYTTYKCSKCGATK